MEALRRRWGKQLELARVGLDLTQRQLADRCGVTQQTISSIESGLTAPRDDLKVRLAAAVGTSIADLFPYPDDLAEQAEQAS